jgi:hypothetical protein
VRVYDGQHAKHARSDNACKGEHSLNGRQAQVDLEDLFAKQIDRTPNATHEARFTTSGIATTRAATVDKWV